MTAAAFPEPKCPAAWLTGRAAGGWLHCVLDPLLHGEEDWHEDPRSGRWKVTLSVGDFPVSGRSEPRAAAEPAAHEARLWRRADEQFRADGFAFRLKCEPCGFALLIENAHQLEDIVRADGMHEGGEGR
jgi:hypothetical protein